MAFSPEQNTALAAKLDPTHVKNREQGRSQVSYIESWHTIAEANRIFGFDGWSSETVEIRCVSERERKIGQQQKPGWGVTYTAKVRVAAGGIIREGVGAGHGIDVDLGQAHESAIKEAESDSRKRALMTFGWPFGLALYDKSRENVGSDEPAPRPQQGRRTAPASPPPEGDPFAPLPSLKAPTAAQVGIYRERAQWLQGAKTPEDLKKRAKNPEHAAEVAKLTEGQVQNLRDLYADTFNALQALMVGAG